MSGGVKLGIALLAAVLLFMLLVHPATEVMETAMRATRISAGIFLSLMLVPLALPTIMATEKPLQFEGLHVEHPSSHPVLNADLVDLTCVRLC